jgi:hypothetical protein
MPTYLSTGYCRGGGGARRILARRRWRVKFLVNVLLLQ